MWSNAIVLFNVVTSALIATNFWEPVVSWLMSKYPGGVFIWDYAVLWLLFAASYTVYADSDGHHLAHCAFVFPSWSSKLAGTSLPRGSAGCWFASPP